jgi:hypothetical protein
MNCPDAICRLVTCAVTDDIPSYLGAYSLQSGSQYSNLSLSIPVQGGFYVVPPGTIVINLPPNPTGVSYMGCRSMVNEPIPTGATPAQILAIVSDVMNQVAAQIPGCNANAPVFNPSILGSFTNGPITVPCADGKMANLIGDLPPGVTLSSSGVSISGGVFSSGVSQDDADSIAEDYLSTFFGTAVECGYFNAVQNATCCDSTVQSVAAGTIFSVVSQADADAQALAQASAACPTCYFNVFISYTCPDSSVQTVAAGTYMSTVSQAAADALALAAAMGKCPISPCNSNLTSLVWSSTLTKPSRDDLIGSGTASGSGAVVTYNLSAVGTSVSRQGIVAALTTTIVNSGGTDCHFQVTDNSSVLSLAIQTCVEGPSGGSQPETGSSINAQGITGKTLNNNSGGGCAEIDSPGSPTFTVPASSSLAITVLVTAESGNQSAGNSSASIVGSFTIAAV